MVNGQWSTVIVHFVSADVNSSRKNITIFKSIRKNDKIFY